MKSRMRQEFHVRICERLRGKFPRATRPELPIWVYELNRLWIHKITGRERILCYLSPMEIEIGIGAFSYDFPIKSNCYRIGISEILIQQRQILERSSIKLLLTSHYCTGCLL